MLRRSLLFAWSAASPDLHRVEELVGAGQLDAALVQLDGLKELQVPIRHVDYWRAVVFLKQRDVLQARQALLEELRWFPVDNRESSGLFHRLESKVGHIFELPQPVIDSYPLFAMLYDAVKTSTMLSWPRLLSLFVRAKSICENDAVEGDFVECGVAGGGSAIIIGAAIQHFSKRPRKLYACDTYQGMPPPSADFDVKADESKQLASQSHWGTGTCSAPLERMQSLIAAFSLQEIVVPVKGLFEDSLPNLVKNVDGGSRRFAMMHLDADWYASTKTALNELYPALEPQGVVQLDDYTYWGGVKQAVEEYFKGSAMPKLEEIPGEHAVVLIKP